MFKPTRQCEAITRNISTLNKTQLPLLLWGLSRKRICLQFRRHRFNPWAWKGPWKRKWQPFPAFLPAKSHGQKPGGLQCMESQKSQTQRLNNGPQHSWAAVYRGKGGNTDSNTAKVKEGKSTIKFQAQKTQNKTK